ncbi:hypothetical protein PQX77_010098 [Marasmius sp. AFHP31]|nr:hypothetical protein PQX77_010098 [Marasmius sp. AFHP31]
MKHRSKAIDFAGKSSLYGHVTKSSTSSTEASSREDEWLCDTCGIRMEDGSREQHLQGKRHQKKLALLSASSQWTCDVCNITCSDRKKHLKGKAHKRALEKTPTDTSTSAFKEAEKDKNGLTLKGDFDLGIVDPEVAAQGITIAATVVADLDSQVELIVCTLASSKGTRLSSPFRVTVQENDVIDSSTPLHLEVHMTTKNYGIAEDRLELIFQDTQLHTCFLICRTLRVHVGSQSDHNELEPATPYVPKPKKRSARQPEKEVVHGELAPSLRAIPYVRKLPMAFMTYRLVRSLALGNSAQVVEALRKHHLPKAFDSVGYADHFRHLLWAEEFQMERDLEYYDMTDAKLTQFNSYYYLEVPGLAENRPSILVGDRILVQKHGSVRGHWFEGGVHIVRKSEVGMKFDPSFEANPDDLFLVRFKLNRYPLRRAHHAMDFAFAQDRVLFPAPEHLKEGPIPQGIMRGMFNPAIGTNPRQLQAVASISRAPPGSVPFVLFGPPGTGKTVTMIEAIRQILEKHPRFRVLACAPSNSAADLIALRLTSLGPDVLFRAYASSRTRDQVPDELDAFTYRNADGFYSVPGLEEMLRFRVVVTTCISANIVAGTGIRRGHYSHIFIDEAGQANEPEAMIAIKSMTGDKTNVVLCGDPRQLGPVVRSGVARRLGLEVTFMERLMKREVYDEVKGYGKTVVKLTKNYRSHDAILKFPNERFYGGDLESCADPNVTDLFINSAHVVAPNLPVVFYSVSGKDEREKLSPSFFNIDEVTVVKSIVEKLRSDRGIRLTDDDIGVIAPYHGQVVKLRTAFRSFADSVKVASVEEFQGQERKVIIVSTVRSSREFLQYDMRHTLGFVANSRRFNVAVTRAQSLLIIVGDPNVLSLDPLWRSFMNYVYQNGGWTGPEPVWDTEEDVDFDAVPRYDAEIREKARDDLQTLSRMMEVLRLDGVPGDLGGDGSGESDYVDVDRPWGEMSE